MNSPRTYVLVHGAFHGAWCWVRVAERLRAAGHKVFTPTLTGLGERAHLLSPAIDIETFVQDVAGVIESEELDDLILVGHSFAGIAITGVADRIPSRLRHVVYLDAAVALSGVSALSQLPPEIRDRRRKSMKMIGGTPCYAPPRAGACGVTRAPDIQWVERRLTPTPVRPYETALRLSKPACGEVPATFVRCTGPAIPQAEAGARISRANGWDYLELPTGHDAMITAPKELTGLLADIA